MNPTWHLDQPLWRRYVDGHLDDVTQAAVEAHIAGCTTCRAAARDLAEVPSGLWEGVHLEIARPRLPASLRWTGHLGVREPDLTILATGRDLALAGVTTLAAVMASAFAIGLLDLRQVLGADLAFLVLAPLVPMLAVAATYDATDPLREISSPCPYPALRLAMIRTAGSLLVALPATAGLGALLPGVSTLAAGWLLPALVLSLATLCVLTWTTARVAASIVAGCWAVVVLAVGSGASVATIASQGGQSLAGVAGVVLLALFVVRSLGLTTTPTTSGGLR